MTGGAALMDIKVAAAAPEEVDGHQCPRLRLAQVDL
jgi:hypothetical protein